MDGAASWTPVGGIGGATVIAVDPQKTSTIYAVTGHGVLKSTDGGANWRSANSGLADIPVSLLVIDPVTTATLYAVTSGGIFKSTDAGGSWNSINSGIPQDAAIQTVVLDPMNPLALYAVGLRGVIFKSTDGGATWAAIWLAAPATAYADSLAIDPVSPDTIYATSFAAGFGSVSKSVDGGKSWNAVRSGIPFSAYVMSFAIDPTQTDTVYASYSAIGVWGVLKSTDGGQSWNAATVASSSNDDVNSQVVIDPTAPSTIYAGFYDYSTGYGGILKSTDSGQTWNAATAGLSNFSNIRLLAMDSVNASTVYAGGGGNLFKSVDRGASWSTIEGPPPGVYPDQRSAIRSLLIDSTNPEILYVERAGVDGCAENNRNLFKSIDGGVTWSSDVSPPNSGCLLSGLLVADPADPKTIYAGETDDFDGGAWLLKSVDGGATWNYAWNGATGLDYDISALVIDPTNPTTLYAATFGGLYKSSDGGASSYSVGFSNSAVTALAIDPTSPSTLYASVEGDLQGLFKSTDGGASWLAINNGLNALVATGSTITALALTPGNSNVLYAATAGLGIYQSIDGGAHWNPFNDGLTNLDVLALIVAPGSPGTLYAGTSVGIFKLDDEPSRGNISASPNPCSLVGSVCTSYLNWTTAAILNAQVWAKIDNGPELQFAAQPSCGDSACPAPWIQGDGRIYTFTLYDCDGAACTINAHDGARAISSVQVSAREPLAGVLSRPNHAVRGRRLGTLDPTN
jgi:photosystem II stability/assembly factor-like uncharacterized protein